METYGFIAIAAVLLAVIVLAVIDNWSMTRNFHATIQSIEDARAAERKEWAEERAQLMDRIQAPSFQDFKTQQTRQIKALKQEPEQPQQPLL